MYFDLLKRLTRGRTVTLPTRFSDSTVVHTNFGITFQLNYLDKVISTIRRNLSFRRPTDRSTSLIAFVSLCAKEDVQIACYARDRWEKTWFVEWPIRQSMAVFFSQCLVIARRYLYAFWEYHSWSERQRVSDPPYSHVFRRSSLELCQRVGRTLILALCRHTGFN